MRKSPFYAVLAIIVLVPQILFLLFFPPKGLSLLYLLFISLALFFHFGAKTLGIWKYTVFLPATGYAFTHLGLLHLVENLFFLSTSFLVVLLLSQKGFRNYLYIGLLSFLNLTLVSVNFQNLLYGVFLLFYLQLLVFLFLLLAVEAFKGVSRKVFVWLLKYSLATFAAVVLFGGLLFFLLPRPQQPIFALVQKELPTAKIGFSGDVRLGAFSSVAEDTTVVFRAKLSEQPEELYWRGNTLEVYRRGVWLPYRGIYSSYQPLGGNYVKEEILLNPYGDKKLFTLYYPVRVERANIRLVVDRNRGVVESPTPFEKPLRAFIITTPLIKVSLKNETPLLEVPKGLAPLLDEIIEGNHLRSPYLSTTLKRLKKFFSTFRYSTTNRARNLVEFLKLYREGNCEYFATASALILRRLGYPTRLVVGFYGGEYNPVTGYYVVRQRDAHAWVEIYHRGKWVRFDATKYASATLTVKESRKPVFEENRLLLVWDTLNTLWLDYVINLDREKQFRIWREGVKVLRAVGEEGWKWLLAGISLLSFVLGWIFYRRYPSLWLALRLRRKYGIRISPKLSPMEIYNLLWKRYPDVWRREHKNLLRM